MAIVLTSTTSSQEEMNRVVSAEGDEWRKSPVIEEPKPDVEETKADVQPTGEADKEGDKIDVKAEREQVKKEHRKPTAKEQARWDRITKEKHEEARLRREAEVAGEKNRMRAEAAEKRAAELEARLNGQPAKQEIDVFDAEPVWQGTDTSSPEFRDYLARHHAWTNAQQIRDEWTESQNGWNARLEEAKAAYGVAAKEYAAKHPEYDSILNSLPIRFDQSIHNAIHFTGNPEVAVTIAKNPALAAEIKQMHPCEATAKIREIARELSDKQNAPVAKPKVKPPEPIAPVGASTTRGNISLNELPIGQYIKEMNKRERENRRR